jgi:molybdopterin synthase sulfur carrier subunit
MKIFAFGNIHEILAESALITEHIENTDELRQKLVVLYPELSDIPFAIAVNNQIIHEKHTLRDDDTVALLPPFSGG